MNFINPTLIYLTNMGWSPDRRINPQAYLKNLIDNDYEVFPAAERFLVSFGGLDGLMPSYKKEGGFERVHFNSIEAVENIYREKVLVYEHRVGESLVVVGEAYNGHLVVLLSETEKLYGAYDDYLCLLGESIVGGISALFLRSPLREIL